MTGYNRSRKMRSSQMKLYTDDRFGDIMAEVDILLTSCLAGQPSCVVDDPRLHYKRGMSTLSYEMLKA